jgi:TonB family protein
MNRPSVEFYVGVPERVFSEVKGVKQELFRDVGMKKPSVRHGDKFSGLVATDLLNEPHLRGMQTQPRISAGHDLLGDLAPAQTKPEMNIIDDALPKFLSAVRKRIESKKRYPMTAQNAGIEGRSGIRMTILKDGKLENAEIMESSGHAILDRAALQSVHNAAPFPPIPDTVKLDRIEMDIRLVFRI